jgi:hypothetical protein
MSYKILRGHWCDVLLDFNAKVGRESIFKLTIENESLQEISSDTGVRLVMISIMSRSQIGLQLWKIWTLRWILIVVGKLLKRI